MPSQVVINVVQGRTLRPSRSFKRGEAVPQFSVGSRGDWIVSAPGVVSFHVLLIFDGERVFAASIDANAPVYLQGVPIGNNWNLVAPSAELRFGEASIVVARQASNAPPAGRSAFPPRPTRPPQAARVSTKPPETVREPGPGNTQFFENLPAQQEKGAGAARPAPAAGSNAPFEALATAPTMAALTGAPGRARPQVPATFPMAPALPSPPPPPPLLDQSRTSDAPGAPPVLSAPALPGLMPPVAPGLPTLASQSALMNQVTGAAWRDAPPLEQATYFAPPGSIALPAQDLRPTDDGGPLPLALPSPLPPLPMPMAMPSNAAEGEPFSTVHAGDDAMRNFAVNLPPNPMDPALPAPNAAYMPTYAESHVPLYATQPPLPHNWSQNPRAHQKRGNKWLLLILLPVAFVILLLAAVFYFGILR